MASVLTFAYLRELQKKERAPRRLEKLPDGFYNTLSDYIARKGMQKDAESTLPVIKYILERREQKVLELAAMSVSAGITPENLLPEERELFEAAQSILKVHRDMIGNIFEKKSNPKEESTDKKQEQEKHTASDKASVPLQEKDAVQKEPSKGEPAKVRLEILKETPSFIAEDFAAHGPWKQGDVVECLPKAAKVLVENGFAKHA